MFNSTVLIHIWKTFWVWDLSGKNSNLYGTFCVSVIKGVPVAERMKKREDMPRIQLRPVSVLRRWNPQTNGAAKLSRGKQSSSLQGENTSTEIDTQAHEITHTHTHTETLTYTVWIKIPADWEGNVHKKWVKHWKCNLAWHHLNSPRFLIHFNRSRQPQRCVFSDIRWSGCVATMKQSTKYCLLIQCYAFTCIEHLHCISKVWHQ